MPGSQGVVGRTDLKTNLLLVSLALGLAPSAASAQTVDTAAGAVSGSSEAGVSAFLGIPYAAPPVGENRWRAPQPVEPWQGTRDATRYGSDCAQAPFPPDAAPNRTTPTEDCLFVNVWTPQGASPNDKLPVMVWIHGGGFVNGGTSPAIYSGHNFARDGVILVSVNYRLGRYGFFAHPALAAEGFGGNFGFLDQIAALEWVRDNIVAFGGDPARVTAFGESAGGMSMHMLLQSPLAHGLFSGAIIESGGGRDRASSMPTLAAAAVAGTAFAPGLDAQQLRALPEQKVTGDLSMSTSGQPGYSGPMIDGRTILGSPITGAQAGLYADVPVIIGANSADGFPSGTDKEAIFAAFGDAAQTARTAYDPDGATPGLELATKISADETFIEPARAVARVLAGEGRHVWLYRFAHNGVEMGVAMGGAPHASEIPFVFETQDDRRDALDTGKDADVARLTHRYWVAFAKRGEPSGDDLPAWPQMTTDDTKVLVIGTDETSHREDPRTAQLDFRESLATGSKTMPAPE